MPSSPEQGAEEVTVWVDDPTAVRFRVNGREIGTLGERGDPSALRRFTAQDGVGQ